MRIAVFTLRKKLIFAATLMIIIAIIATTIPIAYFFSQHIEKTCESKALQSLKGLNNALDDYKKKAKDYAVLFSQYPGIIEKIEKRDTASLIQILQPLMKPAGLDLITVTDEAGNVIARVHEPQKYGDNIAKQYNVQMALTGIPTSAIEEVPLVKISAGAGAPVTNQQGKIVGVISTGYDLTQNAIVDKIKSLFQTDATLFLGDVRVSTTIIKDGQRVVGSKLDKKIAEIVLEQGEQYLGKADILGTNYITAYIPLKGPQEQNIGVIFTGEKLTEMMAIRNKITSTLTVIALVVLLTGTGMALVVSQTIAKPVETMTKAIEKDSNGRITVKEIQTNSHDEVGQLSTALNELLAQLRSFLQEVDKSSEELAAASQELNSQTEETAQSSERIAHSMQDVASKTEGSAKETESASKVTREIAIDIKQAAEHAQTVAQNARNAAGVAEKGNRAINEAINKVNSVGETIDSITKDAKILEHRSQEINRILETITAIADQTNLLSLNAAIEAARAGEQGKGFAVVAQEVGKLARQSVQSSESIGTLIKEIQGEIKDTVLAVEKGHQEIQEGIAAVNTAGVSFGEILQSSQETVKQVENASTSLTEIAAGVDNLVDIVREIQQNSQDSLSSTQEIAASVEEQSAAIEELASSANLLSQMAEHLQHTTSKFKI